MNCPIRQDEFKKRQEALAQKTICFFTFARQEKSTVPNENSCLKELTKLSKFRIFTIDYTD